MSRKIDKPWGYELIWAETPYYVGKILFINKGCRLSKQFHLKKDETFLVQKGEIILETNQDDEVIEFNMRTGDVFHCPPYTLHRISAITEAEIVEVSTPELDDIVRIEDDYNR